MNKTITELLEEYKDSKFKWGKMDCVAFAANIAYKFKDKPVPNIQKDWEYHDAKSALKWLKNLNIDDFNKLYEAPELFVGLKKKDISDVIHGDIVYYINEKEQGIFGICNGCRAYFLSEEGGLTARDIKDCLYCWSVD